MKKICALAATLVLFAAIFVGNAPVEAAAYAGFVETNTYLSKLSMAPSIIAELRTEGQAESYAGLDPKMRPSNAVVTVDDELNVLGDGGKEIGDFSTVFETLSSEGILTVVRLKNRVQADALSAWLIETDEFDLAAMSSDPAVVKYLKTKEKDIRGIADYSAKTAQDLNAAALVRESNENYCNAVLLSQSAATAETVAFFQARFKAVWLAADSAEEFNFYRCVSSGAYGILSDGEPETLYHYYDNYNINSIPRAYLNIAHRGMPYGYPENTLEGCIAAYEAGADAVEIDMKVSKDGEIFILHDSTLERTTDGQGIAEHMTLEQLRQYKVTKDYNGAETGMAYDIPTLDEFFEYFKKIDDCLIVCEIKTTDQNIVQLFSDKVKEYGMYGKVVAIAFGMDMLGLMKETDAGIPTAYLNKISQEAAGPQLRALCVNNTAVDAQCDPTYFWERNLKNRGFVNFSWTYDANSVLNAVQMGVTGITNNVPAAVGGYQKRILPREGYTVASAAALEGASFPADVEFCDRTLEEKQCEVFRYEVSGNEATVILKHKANNFVVYSEPVRVRIQGAQEPEPTPGPKPEPEPSKNGCGSHLAAGAAAGGAALIVLAAVLIRSKRT